MSRNFESEYKEYIENIKPDLWDKISSQLPDRSELQKEADEKIVNFQKHQKKPQFVSKKKKYTRIAGFVAACFCIGILLPFYVNHRQDMINDSQANAYESRPGHIISESSADINKVIDHKTNAVEYLKADVEVKVVTEKYVTLLIVNSQVDELEIDSEINATVKSEDSFTEGESYKVELSKDGNGNFVIESYSLLQ